MNESVILDLGTNIHVQQHCGEPLNRVPVIVPPTWSKGSQYKDLGRVWAKAAAELAAAENIFVVGYSMPETDSFFRYLYALGSQSTTKLRRFWVFDPDPDKSVEQRMKTLIGQGIERHAFNFIRNTFEDATGIFQREIMSAI